jgi:uncharacterized phage-associated protein
LHIKVSLCAVLQGIVTWAARGEEDRKMANNAAAKPIKDGHHADINDVADYIIMKMNEASWINVLKLQKLLYYVQAWTLAFENQRCFDGEFQAWVHGPVNREIYDRFKDRKSMYSRVRLTDMRDEFEIASIPKDVITNIDSVLEAYGDFSDDQLEEMTHNETPWLDAREGCSPRERCTMDIDEVTMREYYAARVKD